MSRRCASEDQRCGGETGSEGWAPPFPLFSEATDLFYTCTWYFAPDAISKAVRFGRMQHLNGFRARMRRRMRLRRRESCSHPCGCRCEIISPAFCQIQHVEFCQPCPIQLISPNQEQTQLSSAAVCKWQAGERAGVWSWPGWGREGGGCWVAWARAVLHNNWMK